MDLVKKIKIQRYENGIIEEKDDLVIIEYTLEILINFKPFIKLLCTPKSLKALVVGFLSSEGVIKDYKDILEIKINEEKAKAYVTVSDEMFTYIGDNLMTQRTITTGCGKGVTFTIPVIEETMGTEPSPLSQKKFDEKKLLKLSNDFSKESDLFKKTGGVHSCGLCTENDIIYFEEDIGRHNALDKVIGRGIIDGIDFSKTIVLTTGRMSSEIITKAAKRKISVIISRAAPTDIAIELAIEMGIRIIGFARGSKMNIYN